MMVIAVKVGITNGRVNASVEGDLREGDAIIIGQNEPATRAANSAIQLTFAIQLESFCFRLVGR